MRSLNENYVNIFSCSYLKLIELLVCADMFSIDKFKQISQKRMVIRKPWDMVVKRPRVERVKPVWALEVEPMRAITP